VVTPVRLLALASAVVVAGGVAVAATQTGSHESRPSAEATIPTPPAASPSRSVAPTTPAPTHSSARPTVHNVEAKPLYPLPAGPAYPHPCPPPPIPPGHPVPPPKPKVPTSKLPKPVPLAAHHPNLRAVRGKGMWITTWQDTKLDVPQVIAKATAAHLTQLWLRTGGTKQGFYGHHALDALLPAAHRAGLDVIAWDFPAMSDPVADANRAIRTITTAYGGEHIDGFSPDIETINEGTFNAPARVRVYLSRVRAAAPNLPLIATVMRPTPYQLRTYPYAAEAPYVDVFAPMVYWSCNEPGALALESYRPLAKMRPVHLIGQSYNMAPEGGRHGLPTGREIWRFLDVAKRAGAIGASLYVYSETRAPQWTALGAYPWSR